MQTASTKLFRVIVIKQVLKNLERRNRMFVIVGINTGQKLAVEQKWANIFHILPKILTLKGQHLSKQEKI